MQKSKSRLLQGITVTGLVAANLLLVISSTFALNKYLKQWEDYYPASHSADANCVLCHGTNNGNLNAYGKDLCDAFAGSVPVTINAALEAIEGTDSDGYGGSNLSEITAGAQPGWTAGANNQLYAADVGNGCVPIGLPISPPTSVPLPYDPPVGGDPVAIPGGPYTGNVNVPITFNGSASYDSDETDVIEVYNWNFGDGTTGTGMTAQHAYILPGTFTVTLAVTDDEGQTNEATTMVTVSGEDVLDLDIAMLGATRTSRVVKAIAIELAVTNDGPILGQAFATVIGLQNGVKVYEWRLNVFDYPDNKATSFNFPDYTPEALGTIYWTADIADIDPDDDLVTATTVVK